MKTLQQLEDSYYDSGAYKTETFSDFCDSYVDYMNSIAEDSQADEEPEDMYEYDDMERE